MHSGFVPSSTQAHCATSCSLMMALAAVSGCADASGAAASPTGADGATATAQGSTVAARVVNSGAEGTSERMAFLDGGTERSGLLAAGGAGQALRGNLSSLEYFITSIQICQSLSTQGSGYSDPKGCITLYENPQSRNYSAYDATAARGETSGYANILDSNDLATLSTPRALSSQDAGRYSWGLINWLRPVRIRAEVPLADGSGSLFTHDGALDAATGNTVATDLSVGPAEQAVVTLQNGGNWFKFQTPFEIGLDDIAAHTQFTVDLAFNPDNLVAGFASTTRTGILTDSFGHGIFVPMLDLAPVPHRADEPARKETYIIHPAVSPSQAFDLRLELYTLAAEAETAVYGADLVGIILPGSTSSAMAQKVSFVEMSGAETSFFDYAHQPLVTGLKRSQTVGASGTVTLSCNGAMPALTEAGCASGTVDATWELVAVSSVP